MERDGLITRDMADHPDEESIPVLQEKYVTADQLIERVRDMMNDKSVLPNYSCVYWLCKVNVNSLFANMPKHHVRLSLYSEEVPYVCIGRVSVS